MRVLVGTSGFSYGEWKGSFYPEDLDAASMLAFYSRQLVTVEINNTFYRMPKRDVVAAWATQVPDDFSFVIKASRRITHFGKLADTDESLRYLFEVTEALGERLGVTLFQLPPWFRQDLPLLDAFLGRAPQGRRVAFEFRHESWFVDETYDVLRRRGAALVGGDPDDGEGSLPFVATAEHGYLRLRGGDYDDAALDAWAERVRGSGLDTCWVFFKHELIGPALAARFQSRFALTRPPLPPLPERKPAGESAPKRARAPRKKSA